MIPEELRVFETYVIAYSGGMDSTAVLALMLKTLPREKIRVVYTPTGVAWPETTPYMARIEQILGVHIEHAQAGDRPLPSGSKERQGWASAADFYEMVRERGRWPSFWQRYCTKYLKIWPLRLYAADCEKPVLIFGDRAQESKAREGRRPFGPDVVKVMKDYRFPNYRPILKWSRKAVKAFLAEQGIPVNPLYKYVGRCGCWCCPLASYKQILTFCRLYPDLAQEASDVEKATGHTWQKDHSITNLLLQTRREIPMPLWGDET